MDTSQPTYFLTYWVRERQRWTLEEAIRKMTSDTAALFDESRHRGLARGLGLANALKKIAGVREGSVLRAPHASMVRHMFFSNAAK